jgi:aspartate kinase
MKILKFGGSSVRNAEWMSKVLDIAEAQLAASPVLVSSAMGDTTDVLQQIADFVSRGEREPVEQRIRKLKKLHFKTARDLLSGGTLSLCEDKLKGLFDEFLSVIQGLSLLQECTPRSNDLILSFGERMSTLILAAGADERNIRNDLLDARDFIKTDENFSQASPLEDLTNRCIQSTIKPHPGKLLITQGFIGSTAQGMTTTLGRGGSDYTAAIIGAGLQAEEIQIWTDVDGIMTTDPRVVPEASTIPVMSYREAAELSYFGARVIHPSTVQPAVNQSIPICVRNTGNPGGVGTTIVAGIPAEGPKAVALKKDITVINISSGRMLLAYGFLKSIFQIFEKHRTPVDLIATSEVSVSMTIDNRQSLDGILKELAVLGTVSQEGQNCIICLVGQDLWKNPTILSRVFSTLQSIPVRMISLGASDTNLSLVVPQKRVNEAVRRLHHEFFE